MVWWLGLNLSRYRALFFGTFGFSVYSATESGIAASADAGDDTSLNYGVIDADGNVNVRIIYDHRVYGRHRRASPQPA